MFEVARVHLHAPDFETRVAAQLEADPELIELWESFSQDNRGTPASYLKGTTVGRWADGDQDVVVHPDRVTACTDFIHRRSVEVLTHQRLRRG